MIQTLQYMRPIQATIIDDINDAAVDLIDNTLDIFWAVLGLVKELLRLDPTSGTYETTWQVVASLYNTFAIVGSALVILFFAYGFCRDAVDIKSEMQFEVTVKLFVRLIITINIMNSFISYVPQFVGWSISMFDAAVGVTSSYTHEDIGQDIYDEFGLFTFIIGLVLFLIVVGCSVMVIWNCFGRFINIYILVPFGSIAIATIAAGGQVSQTGYSYIKSMLAYIFEVVAMGVVLSVAGVFVDANVFADLDEPIFYLMEYIIDMLTITTALKGCDGVIRKAFNL